MSIEGQVPWNKGIPCSSETKRKLSKANKGQIFSKEHRKKLSESMKGNTNRKVKILKNV